MNVGFGADKVGQAGRWTAPTIIHSLNCMLTARKRYPKLVLHQPQPYVANRGLGLSDGQSACGACQIRGKFLLLAADLHAFRAAPPSEPPDCTLALAGSARESGGSVLPQN